MKKPKHTPGPWKMWDRRDVDQGVLITDHAGTVGVCRVIGESQKPPTKNAKEICGANAALIAAAPTLKDLLDTAVEYLESDDRESVRRLVADARALLDLLPAEQSREGGEG